VLDRAVEPINRRRLELLDQAQAEHSGAIPVEVLLTSFLRPDLDVLAELRRDRVQVARFLGRAYTQPSPSVASFADQQFEPVFDRFFALLRRALPRSDPEELVQRMRLIVAVVTNLFATAADLHHAGPLGTDDVDEQLRRLLAFCLPGLVAPTGKGTMP
jgi:hypothetical protein